MNLLKNLLIGVATITTAIPVMAAPEIALHDVNVLNNIVCRSRARSKLIELGATNLAPSLSNTQWGTINDNVRALVWCRGDRAIVSVAGPTNESVNEVRDFIGNGIN